MLGLLCVGVLALCAWTHAAPASDVRVMHEEMLYPVMRVRTATAGGSGTVIYSAKDANGEVRTLVLSNHHVVDDAISIKSAWNPQVGKEVKTESRRTVTAEFFRYNNLSHFVGGYAVQADIVAYDKRQDLALLQLRDKENLAAHVARLIPESEIANVHVFDECFAVGASLGHAPLMTRGNIVHLDDEIDDETYWMSTAQIIFGNSGGAMFRPRNGHYEFIGVPSRISVSMSGFSSSPITHMGFLAPPTRVYEFLRDNCMDFIFDKSVTPEECDAERERKAERARRVLEWQLGPLAGDVPDEGGE